MLSSAHQPPERYRSERSPWEGMSGAAVFFRQYFVGVVVEDDLPERWKHSRVGVTSTTAMMANDRFVETLTTHLQIPKVLTGISETEMEDYRFERDYANSIQAEHGKVRIFGIDLSKPQGRGLDLDTAYLSLEATSVSSGLHKSDGEKMADHSAEGRQVNSQPMRIEALLRDRARIMLRGQAGSGKSTLIQWLATKSVAGSFEKDLSPLNHCVPFVLRLRAMFRVGNLDPAPSQFLELDNSPIADSQPQGWAERVLRSGRALLLVDGMDEIPDRHRNQTREWLGRLLEHYPDTWALVTVRPSAVPHNWLEDYDFRNLTLSPMDNVDRTIFIERWHRAASLESSSRVFNTIEKERVAREFKALENALLRMLEVSPQLSALTNSPLLCAMICALHRDRNGALPSGRMEIYRAALGMLLARRDQERWVDLQLEEDEHRSLLQEIAGWLVTGGLVEGSKSDALNQIERMLRSLARVRAILSAEQVYDHMLDRSGLISATSVETFEFIHRTFQDYLAALEFKEARSFDMLATRAHEEQWEDVIRMTVGHCDHRDRASLLQKIVSAGDKADQGETKRRIHLTAGSCLPYATRLDEATRELVLGRVEEIIAGGVDKGDVGKLAAVGDDVISILEKYDVQPWTVQVLGEVRSHSAFEFLRRVAAASDPSICQYIASVWSSFDVRKFAREVLINCDLSNTYLWIDTDEQAQEIAQFGSIFEVTLDGRMSDSIPIPRGVEIETERLRIVNGRDLSNIDFVPSFRNLRHLSIMGCTGNVNLSVIDALRLTSLEIVDVNSDFSAGNPADILSAQKGLRHLSVDSRSLYALTDIRPLENIESLDIRRPVRGVDFMKNIANLFPNLRKLRLNLVRERNKRRRVVDISPFAGRSSFHLRILSDADLAPRVRGKSLFAPEALSLEIFE